MSVSPRLSRQRTPLTGRRILVVEDEYFLADDIGRAFRALGAEIAGPVGHLEDALEILNDGGILDAAVLDVNIRNEMIFPLARQLRARGVPSCSPPDMTRSLSDRNSRTFRSGKSRLTSRQWHRSWPRTSTINGYDTQRRVVLASIIARGEERPQ